MHSRQPKIASHEAETVRQEGARGSGNRLDRGSGRRPRHRAKVVARFYRLDRSRSLSDNGLGLTIVTASSHLHGDSLSLEDAAPVPVT